MKVSLWQKNNSQFEAADERGLPTSSAPARHSSASPPHGRRGRWGSLGRAQALSCKTRGRLPYRLCAVESRPGCHKDWLLSDTSRSPHATGRMLHQRYPRRQLDKQRCSIRLRWPSRLDSLRLPCAISPYLPLSRRSRPTQCHNRGSPGEIQDTIRTRVVQLSMLARDPESTLTGGSRRTIHQRDLDRCSRPGKTRAVFFQRGPDPWQL